jgi:hypothetical protein
MGFLDKAAKAAVQAKQQVDTVRAARAEAAVQPVQHGPLSDDERRHLEQAMAQGAINPFALLSREEASAVVGVELGDAALSFGGGDTVGVQYEARGRGNDHWRVSVDVYYATEPGVPFEAELFLREMVLDNDEGAVQVPGLGDQAWVSYDILWVLYGPILFYVQGTTPAGQLEVEECAQIAQRVVARLEQIPKG